MSELSIMESQFDWKAKLISGLLAIVVTVAGAIIVSKLLSKDPRLVLTLNETIPFVGDSGSVATYSLTVANAGKVPIEDVVATIRVQDAQVEQVKVSASPSLRHEHKQEVGAAVISIPDLNPGESVQVAALLKASFKLPSKPEVYARGKGVTGVEEGPTTASNLDDATSFTKLLSTAALPLALASGFLTFYRRSIGSHRGGDQRQVLASICRMHNLNKLANEYLERQTDTFYWSEADRLGQIAIDTADPNERAAIIRVLNTLIKYPLTNMSGTAKGVIRYNLARIMFVEGDVETAKKEVKAARKEFRAEIDFRLSVDPLLKGRM
jgi:hypothetical protein